MNPVPTVWRKVLFHHSPTRTTCLLIYPGKLTLAESFRIGCIGQKDEHIMRNVVAAVQETLKVDDAAPTKLALIERAKLG